MVFIYSVIYMCYYFTTAIYNIVNYSCGRGDVFVREEYAEIFSAFLQFRKLHMSNLFSDMSHSEFATMVHIGGANKCLNEEKVKVSMLSESMRINITAVSRTLKALEKKAYIKRTVSERDRRITYVELTQEGANVLEESEKIMDEFMEKVLSSIEKEDITRLTALMNRLYNAAEREIEKRKKKGDVTE